MPREHLALASRHLPQERKPEMCLRAHLRGRQEEITWESDSEDGGFGGMSPPKTIQFALPPSKLLQTPGRLARVSSDVSYCELTLVSAREASKRIVDDILLTAGAELDESSEYSPTVVKMNADILDDTFLEEEQAYELVLMKLTICWSTTTIPLFLL